MRFVNSIRDSEDSGVSTLMSDQALSESLFNGTLTTLKDKSSADREAGLEFESGMSCMGPRT